MEKRFIALEQKLERIEHMFNELAKVIVNAKSDWITEADTMQILDLGKKSLAALRDKQVLRYSTASGKKIKYWRKDVEAYLMENSNVKTKKTLR